MGVERLLVDAELRLARVVVGLELLQLDLALFLPRGDLVDLRAPLCERLGELAVDRLVDLLLDGVDVLFRLPPGFSACCAAGVAARFLAGAFLSSCARRPLPNPFSTSSTGLSGR